jgi:RNA polymerase sigma-70 factor (ECF subfamily)
VDAARTGLSQALVAAGEGDRQAFSDVYECTSAKLLGICVRICGERAAAQDVLHDVYLKVWQNAGAFDPSRSSPITWLAAIARNGSVDWRRGQGNRATAHLSEAMMIVDPAENPEAATISMSENSRLHASLSALKSGQRELIRSAFFEGLTYRNLAECTQKPLGTVKSNIRRGLAKMRDDLCAHTNGRPVIMLDAPGGDDSNDLDAVADAPVDAIRRVPGNFYVNMRTAEHLNGAIRGEIVEQR